jgi:GT2 family glycosyltransferase
MAVNFETSFANRIPWNQCETCQLRCWENLLGGFFASGLAGSRSIQVENFILVISIHASAFMKAPKAYLTATWWRICGKKLRARYQFNTLLGTTSYAYRYWIARQKDDAGNEPSGGGIPAIIALIDAPNPHAERNMTATMDSLQREDVPAVVIGGPAVGRFDAILSQMDEAEGLWVMPVGAGDRLRSGGVRLYREAIANAGPSAAILYADDDRLTTDGQRAEPHFKPQWNSELFRHFDFITKSSLLKAKRRDFEGLDQQADWASVLTSRILDRAAPIHVAHMLHHKMERAEPVIPTWEEAENAEYPLVSIIIPTRNRVELLRTCIDGVLATDYPRVEIIVVDNDSDEDETLRYLEDLKAQGHRVLHHQGEFNFSVLNNLAAREAQGEILCMLNNDIEVVEPHWLKAMVRQVVRPDVGAVGAQLLYPDGRIQHAGVVIGVGRAAGHAHKLLQPAERGYFSRHNLPQFVSAVTAACLLVKKDHYDAVGGLDEAGFAVAFNDVDFCLKLNAQGWQSLYEPRAVLVHHESVSRGYDRDPVGAARFAGELKMLQTRWKTDQLVDAYHHPALSRSSENYVLEL